MRSSTTDAEEGSRIPVTIKAIVLEASALSGRRVPEAVVRIHELHVMPAELKANPF